MRRRDEDSDSDSNGEREGGGDIPDGLTNAEKEKLKIYHSLPYDSLTEEQKQEYNFLNKIDRTARLGNQVAQGDGVIQSRDIKKEIEEERRKREKYLSDKDKIKAKEKIEVEIFLQNELQKLSPEERKKINEAQVRDLLGLNGSILRVPTEQEIKDYPDFPVVKAYKENGIEGVKEFYKNAILGILSGTGRIIADTISIFPSNITGFPVYPPPIITTPIVPNKDSNSIDDKLNKALDEKKDELTKNQSETIKDAYKQGESFTKAVDKLLTIKNLGIAGIKLAKLALTKGAATLGGVLAAVPFIRKSVTKVNSLGDLFKSSLIKSALSSGNIELIKKHFKDIVLKTVPSDSDLIELAKIAKKGGFEININKNLKTAEYIIDIGNKSDIARPANGFVNAFHFHLESKNPSVEDVWEFLYSKGENTYKIVTEKGITEYTKADLIWGLKNNKIKKADINTPDIYLFEDQLKLIKNYSPEKYPGDL
jgi:predicted  nucleic acid-binding Zn-ribbon protein